MSPRWEAEVGGCARPKWEAMGVRFGRPHESKVGGSCEVKVGGQSGRPCKAKVGGCARPKWEAVQGRSGRPREAEVGGRASPRWEAEVGGCVRPKWEGMGV